MKIFITPDAKQLLDLYVAAVDGEISGLGVVEVIDQELIITDIMLLEQESGHSDTELDPEAISRLIADVIASGEDPEKLKLWWHSHGSMKAFMSTTDDATASKFGNGWMVSLVLSKTSEPVCQLDVYDPIHLTATATLTLAPQEASAELKAFVKEEVKEKVRFRSYSFTGYGGPSCGQYKWSVEQQKMLPIDPVDGNGKKEDKSDWWKRDDDDEMMGYMG